MTANTVCKTCSCFRVALVDAKSTIEAATKEINMLREELEKYSYRSAYLGIDKNYNSTQTHLQEIDNDNIRKNDLDGNETNIPIYRLLLVKTRGELKRLQVQLNEEHRISQELRQELLKYKRKLQSMRSAQLVKSLWIADDIENIRDGFAGASELMNSLEQQLQHLCISARNIDAYGDSVHTSESTKTNSPSIKISQ